MRSDTIKEGAARAPARAMLEGAGFDDADLEKPLMGIANTWTEVTPCNSTLRALAAAVKEGVRAAGGTPIEFNAVRHPPNPLGPSWTPSSLAGLRPLRFDTIAVSERITMGTDGMRGSLVSREVIADSIELFAMSHALDGVVALSGCDKTVPGTAGHVAPEVALGGPIAFVWDGDPITFDVAARRLDVKADLEARRRESALASRPPRHTRGVMAKYAALVSSASEGAVTRPRPNDLHEGERR